MTDRPDPRTTGVTGYLFELRQHGYRPSRILDIGANIGKFAGLCHLVWPEAHVTSIEANELCQPTLNCTADETHIALLSDAPGERTFYMQADDAISQGNSYYKDQLRWFDGAKEVTLPTTTLSALLAGKAPYQLVKLDTQGSELDIIRGGREIIAAADYIVCELPGDVVNNAGAPSRSEVEAELAALGFVHSGELQNWFIPETGQIVNRDVAFWK